MKAIPRPSLSPLFVPNIPVVAGNGRYRDLPGFIHCTHREPLRFFVAKNLIDRFCAKPGSLVNANPGIFARLEARSLRLFARELRRSRMQRPPAQPSL